MTIQALLERLQATGTRLRKSGSGLAVSGDRADLDTSLLRELRVHKAALLEMIDGADWWSPSLIRPEMLTLVELSQAEIDAVVAGVPGGARNVQDIYPLAPLQEGILFHHLMTTEGDPYLGVALFSFDSRERLDAYVSALQAVVDRHDILRTSVMWEGLSEPVQVVWRKAPVEMEEVEPDPAGGDVAAQLRRRCDPRHNRLDVRRAPLLRLFAARDVAGHRWLLLRQQHHLAGDHVTFDVVKEEILAHLQGRADELPAPLPFRSYVAQARLGVSRAEHEVFFRELLGDVEEPTAPFGLLDAWGDGSGIAEARLVVDVELAVRLRERARRLGVSAASVCHVAWAQVLARVSGREDVVFGTLLFGRMHGGAGADRVLGPFINTLPVRVRVGEEGVKETVRGTHRQLTELLRHEHASLALAQRCSGVAAPAPLFTSLLNYRHVGGGTPRSSGGYRAPEGIRGISGEERTNYPVVLSVDDRGEEFVLVAQAPISVGAERVCAMMHRALEGLVEALEVAPERAVRRVEVLPAAEREQVVEAWNATSAEYPAEACVQEIFEAQARRSPRAVALVQGARTLTYAELNGRANALAHHLVRHGVSPGSRVAILMPRCLELVVAELAILKAGAAYVPLDPSLPAARLGFLVADSGSRVVLGLEGQALPPLRGTQRIDVDTLGGRTGQDLPALLDGGAPAYVMYTSGSTGEPKGVVVPHRAVSRLVLNNGYAEVGPSDRVAFAAHPSFDASTLEVWSALLNGARVVVVSAEEVLEPQRLGGVLEGEGVSVLWLTVGLFNQYAEALKGQLAGLRYLIVGGDRLDPAVIARVLGSHAPQQLINGYGPTETTTFALTHRIERVGEGAHGIPLGRPISNTRVYVLDGAGEPVPVGVAGELYIGGAGVAHGYLNRAGLTAEKFVPDGFGGEAGGRLYRTGDVGRWQAGGTIEFVGRNDHQVKVRGFRIELGEIEARLGEQAGVRAAVVVAREDAPGEKHLVAYYVGEAEAEGLRLQLREQLPEYMVPGVYMRLDRLPLTGNGKVDRQGLPAPSGEGSGRRGYEAPASGTEEAVAEIWREVLGVAEVGRWDEFFELGGHSLRAVQVVSRVRQVLEVEVALGEVFERPVLAEFARGLEDRGRAELPGIEAADRSRRLVLSFAQQRLWFLEQMGGLGSAYHVGRRLRLRGELDRGALVRALERIVERHEALRTTFHAVEGELVQRVVPAGESGFHLLAHEVGDHPSAEAELQRLVSEEAGAPFDLERGPLMRGRLIRLAAEEHVLLLTMHHIVSDAWSMGVLIQELSALYAAYRRGEADPLPLLPVQYADYAAWQRRWVDGEVLQEQADYWREALAGAPELLELPTDRVRPARQEHAGGLVRVVLGGELTAGLKALSQRHGTTLYMTLLAGWAALLGRLSGQEDVVVGTPTANRGRREVEGLIGFFVNTLAIRVELSGSPTVGELLGRVKARALQAQQHQDIPFEQVVELVQPARSLAHNPVFQVMFAWQNVPRGTLELPGLELVPVGGTEEGVAKFDLSLDLGESGGRIVGGVTYATSLFEAATVERYAGYLRRVLEGMAADEGRRVERLEVLAQSERRQVVEAWNRTEAAYPGELCVHELFQAQAGRTPEAVALVFEGETLTYAELNRRANRLAHHLGDLGVGPDVRVGLCLERSPEMVVAVLAVLKAGGAYVPLDPEFPAPRLHSMLAESEPAVLLTQRSLAGLCGELCGGLGVPVLAVDAAASSWAGQAEGDPPRGGLTPENLAYVIYTSGSTGAPKGVMNAHRGVVNRLLWMQEAYGLGAAEAVLQKTPYSFDVSVWEFFWPLGVGARLVVARPGGHREPAYLAETIRREGITTVHFVPSMLPHFVEQEGVGRCTGLRRVVCSGEALPSGLVERVHERLPGVEVHNLYGPTEAAVDVTAWRCFPGEEGGSGRVPLGRPVSNTRIYVLDREGEPVPVGVAGELYIGGVQVSRGYQKRADLTAERFVPDAFGGEAGARLYRTGDVGRWVGEGRLEYLGRNDFQVKVRGFRIELGEIEARLGEHAGVREAVVVGRADAPGEARLVAYYVGGEAVAVEALRSHLGERLPEHMVPAAYVRLERLPLTANGKLDRRGLPAPEGDAYARRGYEAPEGEVEQTLAQVWAEVLGVERVGRHDHFFELGGHSLLAVQVVSRVRQVLGLEAALGDLFALPVLADFAAFLGKASRIDLPVIGPAPGTERLALSFAQQRLWFLYQMGSAGTAYHIPIRLRFRGELDRPALNRALDRIVARHEALRTRFPTMHGEPVQRCIEVEESALTLVEHDLGGHPGAEAELRRLMEDEARAPFDLEQGPLIRGRLVRIGDEDRVLLLTMHHIVSDGWSTGVLVRELGVLYGAFRRGDADPLPPLPVQYADYAAWQRRWVDGEVLREQAAYWRETLSGAPELLEVPADHPRPARQDHAGDSIGFSLGGELTAGLKALSQRHGTTLYMTLLAGWAALLGRLSGQEDVVVGTPTANRGRREVEGLIGFFVNTLAIRVELSGSPTVGELLGRVKARALQAQQHQDIPFEQVVELVQPARSLAHSPVFQVMFAWQNAPRGTLELPGLELARVPGAPQDTAKFDLSLTLSEQGDRIAGGVEYATALFERATVERYLGYLRRVVEGMVAQEGRSVESLPLLPDAEREQVVEAWNATSAEYPAEACVQEIFEAQARRSPRAVALVQGARTLTYAELNGRANALAHHLVRHGVSPGSRVAILMPRSLELVVAELAILKAGAAYVPLDPSLPAARLGFLVADSGSRVVLGLEGQALPPLRGTQRIDVDTLGGRTGQDLPALLDGGAPAYVMYTSGSTGEPKGVVVPHRAVSRLVLNNGYAEVGPSDRVAFAAHPSFDASTLEVWSALLNGARVVVVSAEEVLEPQRLGGVLEGEGVSVLWLTVGLFNQYAEALKRQLAGLRYLIVGGDRLDPAVIARVLGSHAPQQLINGYGPTETTTFALTHRIERVGEGAHGIPLGRPISNTRVYVLDGAGEPVPVGVAGELYIGGAGVAHGYLNRAGLTAEKFVPDGFGGEAGGRLYRTGDVGRWQAGGTIEFVGRNDHQVKVRGFRIELGEIEARLGEQAGVRAAVVVAREDAPGEKHLVAYYVGEAEAEGLRLQLREQLPEYMVPGVYMRLDRLPLTGNGKVDRQGLPAPSGEGSGRRGYEAPASGTEEAVAEIWREVLGVAEVGRWDEFFELGGHSLRAVQVVSRVRQVLELEVALGEVFERPVLAEFARGLEDRGRAELPGIEAADRSRRLVLSFAQQRLWFLEQLGALGAAYHIPMRLRLRGELDREALVRALDQIVARHEALRTTFRTLDGEPVQRIAAEESRFHLVDHDLSSHPGAGAGAELRRLTAEEAGAPFHLERGPLIRGRLIRLAADDHVLVVTMHHIVSDGWSMGVFTQELGTLYTAFRGGDADPLPPLPIQYADYAAWQRRWVDGEVLKRQADYWRETLAGAPELLELPTDHARPARQDFAGALARLQLEEELTGALKALSRRQGTTLFVTLLAGWATVLSRLSGQTDVVIGAPTANRGRGEIERLIGFFVNTLALRVELTGAPTVAELLGRVKARVLEAQQNQDIPFEQVVELVQPARSLAHSPVFQVMFAWQNTRRDRLELPGLEVGPVQETRQATAKFDLSLSLQEAEGRIVGGMEYATALFEPETVERYAGYLRRVLEGMAADADRPVDRLEVLAEEERRQLLEAWNRTASAYPGEVGVHELFAAQAGRTPGAVAVVQGERTLTYAELDAWAHGLAQHLRRRGVRAGSRVALLLPRSVELVVAELAVLRAGAAYVPLDASYPAERTAFMIADSGARLLLSRSGEPLAPLPGVDRVDVDTLSGAGAAGVAGELDAAGGLGGEALAYVMYTSGSTGEPKGVMVPHRAITQLVLSNGYADLDAEDRVALASNPAFDASTLEVWGPLLRGGRIVVVGQEVLLDAPEYGRLLEAAGVTALLITPVLFNHYAQVIPGALSGLRYVLTGGDRAAPAAYARVLGEGGRVRIYNCYGPTETTTFSLAHGVEVGEAVEGGRGIPIGRPKGNTRAYVLDGSGAPVPVGVVGELYVGGAGVALGYWGRAGLTAEKFVPDGLGGAAGGRLYRTGDLVRWRGEGEVEFVGRNDFQVKVRGFRIELSEIEARLGEHEGVEEAVVVAREEGAGEKRLVAYYVGDAGVEALRGHLGDRVAEYMVPGAYVRLAALPRTPNGKVDRRGLPAPEGDAYARRGYEAPVGETEGVLAQIWAEVLGVERVGRHDHFFELGGHSLLAVKLIERMRQHHLHVDVGLLFATPTVAGLASVTEQILEFRL